MNLPLDPLIQQRVQKWLDGPYDAQTKEQIKKLLRENPQALVDAFYTDLSFGTAGLRGIMGVGTNRMNQYTVRIATQGLANYINKQPKIETNRRVFIGYDSRHNSDLFAKESAQVLAANGIQAYLLKELRPVPFVSFGTRYCQCTAGIMITASHNPAEYNGYKVFWSDGGQVVPPHDTGIMKEVLAVTDISSVKLAPLNHTLIVWIDSSLDEKYLSAIHPLQHMPEENKRSGKDLKITYTSLHGTGITLAPKALNDWGFSSLNYVEQQIKPDGDFPTVKFPNPEYPEAMKLGLEHLKTTQSDILIANDPDADRLGVAALHKGIPFSLTGNEIAAICVEFLCEILTSQNRMPPKGAFVTTIVSTELIKAIADSYQRPCFEVLTGFKYIGEMIHQWETSRDGYQFLFGAEESYGFLLGTVARDKDAIVSSCLVAEIALYSKLKNQTLIDRLEAIYRKYGIFLEKQHSVNFNPGKEGMDKMKALMGSLRQNPPQKLGGSEITLVEDYASGERKNLKTGKTERLTLPKSDVLLFRNEENKLIVRPSGTEPKLKLYAAVHQKEFPTIEEGLAQCDKRLDQMIKAILEDLNV